MYNLKFGNLIYFLLKTMICVENKWDFYFCNPTVVLYSFHTSSTGQLNRRNDSFDSEKKGSPQENPSEITNQKS